MEQGSLEWHEWRDKHANASEAAAVLGIGRFNPSTPRELCLVRRGDVTIPKTNAMKRGLELEGVARKYAEGLLSKGRAGVGKLAPSVTSATIDGIPMSSSLDGFATDGSFKSGYWVEVKVCASAKSPYWTEAASGKIEPSVRAQMTHQFLTLQEAAPRVKYDGYLYVCVHDEPGSGIVVPFLPTVEETDALMDAWQRVWPHIVAGTIYGERDDAEWHAAALAYRTAKARADAYELQMTAARAKLLSLSGGVEAHGHGVMVASATRSGGYDYSKLSEDILATLPRKRDTQYMTVRVLAEEEGQKGAKQGKE